MQRKWKRRFGAAVVLLIAAAGLAGCAANPVAPVVDAAAGGSPPVSSELQVLTVSPDGLAGFVPVPPESTTDSQMVLLNQDTTTLAIATELPSALLVRASIYGPVGGTVRCGRFRLDFPPGAFAGTATIQMAAPDSTVMLCDFSISPAELNDFSKPVLLTLDAGNLTVSASTLTIYWYDRWTGLWVDMRSTRDLATGQVTQKLTHFSRYVGGKAGW